MNKAIKKMTVLIVVIVMMFGMANAHDYNSILVVGNTAIEIQSFFDSPGGAEQLVNEILANENITSMEDIWYRSEGGDYINVATNQMVEGTAASITDRIEEFFSVADVVAMFADEYEDEEEPLLLCVKAAALHVKPNETVDIIVTVTTESGVPVEGAIVNFSAEQDQHNRDSQLADTRLITNPDGQAITTYKGTSTDKNKVIGVQIHAEWGTHHLFDYVSVTVADQVATVEGRVTDRNTGTPLANVAINFWVESENRSFTNTTTDAEGLYLVALPILGDYGLWFRADKYQDATASVKVTAANTPYKRDRDMVLYSDLGIVTGTIIDNRTGRPAAYAEVYYDNALTIFHFTETDENGVFSFYVPPGIRSISIVLPGSREPDLTIRDVLVEAGKTTPLGELRLR